MRIYHFAVIALVLAGLCTAAAPAQSLQERIRDVRRQNSVRDQTENEQARREARNEAALRAELAAEGFGEEMPAREALDWLSRVSGISFIVNWDQLEEMGVDPELPVRLAGENLTTRRALEMLLDQIEEFEPLIWEPTPWYVRIMTKQRANRDAQVVVYPVGDLLMRVPQFTNAPAFDLSEITQGDSSGGGGGGGSQGLFDDEEEDDELYAETRYDRALQLADLIRQTIEPDLWRANGGLYGSISIFGDSLVVRAPMYVHRQIDRSAAAGATRRNTVDRPAPRAAPRQSRQTTPNRSRSDRYTPGRNAGVIQPLRHER